MIIYIKCGIIIKNLIYDKGGVTMLGKIFVALLFIGLLSKLFGGSDSKSRSVFAWILIILVVIGVLVVPQY